MRSFVIRKQLSCSHTAVSAQSSPPVNLQRDRQTFFAHRIISFLPDRTERRFRAPLRRIDFLHDHAVYRDPRRKVEIVLDPVILPIAWEPTWNQWKHLLPTKIGLEGTFRSQRKVSAALRHLASGFLVLRRTQPRPTVPADGHR